MTTTNDARGFNAGVKAEKLADRLEAWRDFKKKIGATEAYALCEADLALVLPLLRSLNRPEPQTAPDEAGTLIERLKSEDAIAPRDYGVWESCEDDDPDALIPIPVKLRDDLVAALRASPPPDTAEPTISDEQISTIWTAAMTAACNIVVQRQNDLNDDDGPIDILNEQDAIAAQIKKYLQPDEDYLSELRALLSASPPAPAGMQEPRGFIVANANEDKFRFWGAMGPTWTTDRTQALRFARRIDAERFSEDDEDGWKILEVGPVSPAEMQWRDMASAPKNGTQIIVVNAAGNRRVAEYKPALSSRSPEWWATLPGGWKITPVAWQPLPPAPQQE